MLLVLEEERIHYAVKVLCFNLIEEEHLNYFGILLILLSSQMYCWHLLLLAGDSAAVSMIIRHEFSPFQCPPHPHHSALSPPLLLMSHLRMPSATVPSAQNLTFTYCIIPGSAPWTNEGTHTSCVLIHPPSLLTPTENYYCISLLFFAVKLLLV